MTVCLFLIADEYIFAVSSIVQLELMGSNAGATDTLALALALALSLVEQVDVFHVVRVVCASTGLVTIA